MRVLILSPAFPPTTRLFCEALRRRDVTVIGIGDEASTFAPWRAAVDYYVHVPRMHEPEALARAVDDVVDLHGPLDRLDSLGEHWLSAEGTLRDHLGVVGLGQARTQHQRSKSGMAEIYAAAGIAHPRGIRVDDLAGAERAGEVLGYPLVLKPDVGSGAAATFRVGSAEALRAKGVALGGYLAQAYVEGTIVTFDGLTNGAGEVVFCTSHEYDAGIMEVLTGGLDGHYFSVRAIDPTLEALGRRAVAAFEVRERFFHAEFFRLADSSYVALEMNLRPPGGYTTDLMGLACDFDVHALWAGVIAGDRYEGFRYERRYHTAHAGRRYARDYALSDEALARELGETLVARLPVPDAFAPTMGNEAYLLRHADLGALRTAIAAVQRPA